EDEPRAAVRLVPGQELGAAQARHAYVAEDDVGLQLGGAREAFLAVARGLRLIAFLGQDQGDRLAQAWFVVNDQDVHFATLAGAGAAAGRITVKVAPRPGSESARMAPPIDSTSRAHTARPRPVPLPGSFDVTNGSKICGSCDSAIPGPLSVMAS